MALDQEDLEQICADLVHLCQLETKEGMSARGVKEGMVFCGSTTESAEIAKYSAEQRLRILNLLELKADDREEHCDSIRKCIQRLDEFIELDPYEEWADPELEE